MKRWITIILFRIVPIFLLSSIIILLLAGKFYGTEITNYVISELNKKLVGKVSINEVSFSLLRKFPDASVIFTGVSASASEQFIPLDNYEKKFLSAELIFLQLNIRDLLKGEYNINEIHIENATINIASDKNGKFNYEIFTTDKNDTDSSHVKLSLDEVVLKNTYYTFFDHRQDLFSQGKIDKAKLTGSYFDDNFSADIRSSIYIDQFRLKENTFIKKQSIELETGLKYTNSILSFHNAKGYLASVGYHINGDFNTQNNNISLTADIDDTYFSDLLNTVAIKEIDTLKSFDIKGMVRAQAVLVGNSSAIKLICTVATSSTSFSVDNKTYVVKTNGRFEAKNLDDKKTYSFKSDNISLSYKNSTLSGSAELSDFDLLNLSASVASAIDLQDINDFEKEIVLDGAVSGTIAVKTSLKDVKKVDYLFLRHSNFKSNLIVKNASIKNNDFSVSNISGVIDFSPTICKLNGVHASYKGIAGTLNGELKNVLEYAFLPKKSLQGDVVVNSSQINLNVFNSPATSSKSGKRINDTWELPGNLHLNIYVTAQEILYDKISLKNVKTNIVYKKPAVHITSLHADALKGKISGNIKLVQYNNLNCVLKGVAYFEEIDVKDLFVTFDNFDQDFLVSRHLKGKLTADASFFTEWTNDFKLFEKTMFIESSTTISDGHLINFEPLLELSKKEEIEELNQIRFSELKNTIIIKDEQVVIPKMKIESSAFNIDLAGTQNFNGVFEYQFQVLLDEILSKKRQKVKRKNEFGEIEEDGLGRVKIYLVIKGNPDDFKIDYDRKRGKKELQEKVKNEKKALGETLRKEFKFLRKDSTKKESTSELQEQEKDDRKWFKKSEDVEKNDEIDQDITPVFDDF